ncbi:hypothetical protein SAMN05216410_3430 [Sanguibacter gelidistatuariae]|uniref:Uncharacterized protein n=1 Tax=Sanguibacter gelidistatuariae TaxID=1814289 RepID=A0A1G6VG01_9MICO|nr:hypothetical protein [Sanguibacter gelidistatuariae]SDD52602.1 hypothetical protein SAMN05216410_3430 [Sanguibacter gelidistatuariae]
MLHKIVTASLVLVGLVLAGLSVASGTLWRPSDTAVMTTGTQSGTTLLTTAPGVLGLVDHSVTITASSSPEAKVVLALGRSVDVDGWIGEDPALVVTGASDWETLSVTARTGSTTDPATDPTTDPATPTTDATATDAPAADAPADAAPTDSAPTDEAPAVGPDPEGSDMWLTSATGTGSASLTWDASSSDVVLLVAAVGENATTPVLTLTWPREVTTPLMWPGVVLGALLVIAGCIYGLLLLRPRDRVASAPTNSSALRTSSRQSGASTSGPAGEATSWVVTSGDASADTGVLDASARTPVAAEDGSRTTGLTRRELREQAAREEAARLEEVNASARRSKRAWPWTGAIPMVKKSADAPSAPAAPPAADPARPVWLPEGTGSTSGSSWRQAWGVRPDAATPTTGDAAADTTTPTSPPTDGSAPHNNTTTEGH